MRHLILVSTSEMPHPRLPAESRSELAISQAALVVISLFVKHFFSDSPKFPTCAGDGSNFRRVRGKVSPSGWVVNSRFAKSRGFQPTAIFRPRGQFLVRLDIGQKIPERQPATGLWSGPAVSRHFIRKCRYNLPKLDVGKPEATARNTGRNQQIRQTSFTLPRSIRRSG